MTINRDAILSVINSRLNSRDEGLSIPKGLPCISFGLDYLPKALPYVAPELEDTDDDSSISSCSVSTTTTNAKGVSFAAPLVTEVRYRPWTLKKHKAKLYYTVQETARFRQEYREERCRLKQEEGGLETSSNSPDLGEEPGSDNKSSGESHGVLDTAPATDNNNDHRIYKVVVKHKNTLETFIDKEMDLSKSPSLPGKFKTANEDFFDNDSFWNGEITWY